jgi:Fic family protein
VCAESAERHSEAIEPTLVSDPDEIARLEAKNGIRQFDAAINHIESVLQQEDRPRNLRPSLITTMNRFAIEGLSAYAGTYRPSDIGIKGSEHKPPGAHLVQGLVEELCDYVNENWKLSPIHLAAYVMWRLNWIHPFSDGNGRTTRVVSYIVLCIRVGYRLPGSFTIPDQIARNKDPYYAALEKADSAYELTKKVDVSAMEDLISSLLAKQLAKVLEEAGFDDERGSALSN